METEPGIICFFFEERTLDLYKAVARAKLGSIPAIGTYVVLWDGRVKRPYRVVDILSTVKVIFDMEGAAIDERIEAGAPRPPIPFEQRVYIYCELSDIPFELPAR